LRSPVDIVELPYVFTQRPLLTADRFARHAADRSVRLHPFVLESLHRLRLFQPLLLVRRDGRAIATAVRRKDPEAFWLMRGEPDSVGDLLKARTDGRLLDPRTSPFSSYDRLKRGTGRTRYESASFIYSQHQVVALHFVQSTMEQLRSTGDGSRLALHGGRDRLRRTHEAASWWADTVSASCALEAAYYPRAFQIVRGLPSDEAFEQYYDWRSGFDPGAAIRWLGVDACWLRDRAQELLRLAERIDPLGDWFEIVREADPHRWSDLRGEARMAIDLRLDAEVFLLAYEDLAKRGKAAPLPARPPQARNPGPWDGRLSPQGRLDDKLMRFGISPHPRVIVVVEGHTEDLLMPRVMAHYGIRTDDNFIRIFNRRGVDKPLESLVGYAISPRVELDDDEEYVRHVRPTTHLLVITDPEGSMATEQRRNRAIGRWANAAIELVPRSLRSPGLRQEVEELITISAWDDVGSSFEFAHFSDAELAAAIGSIPRCPDAKQPDQLVAAIANARDRGGALTDALDGASKVALADALWPTLERQLVQAGDGETASEIPIVRVLDQALELAHAHRGALIRHQPSLASADHSRENPRF
jgi:hypothetical protein